MSYCRVALVVLLLTMISGCHLMQQNKDIPIVNGNDNNHNTVVLSPPKLFIPNWQTILSPLIDELIETAEVSNNNQLLVSDIKNSSNKYVSSTQVTNILFDLLANQNIFSVIDKTKVSQVKQALGIADDDELISRSKMIALARNIQADYVLFTTITQMPKSPNIQAEVEMELLLVQTGEIVWQFSSNQLVDN